MMEFDYITSKCKRQKRRSPKHTEGKHDTITRLIAAMLLLVLLLGLLPAANADSEIPFRDVASNKWYYIPVVWAYKNHITTGTAPDKYSPKQELSYAQVVTFLHRFADSPTAHYTYANAFQSYANRYYYNSINWACDFNLVSVYSVTGANKPSNQLTRNDFVNIIYRYAKNWEHRSVAVNGNYLGNYEDVPGSDTDRAAWNWAVKIGMIKGTSQKTLSPKNILTRADFITMLYRYETQSAELRGEALIGKRLRGWQRTILETLELAYGVPWVDHAYDIGPDGIPTTIDCSGILEWAFNYTGIYAAPDLESIDLWNSDHFTCVFTRKTDAGGNFTETGYEFINRVRGSLRPGDMIFCGYSSSTYHVMMYLGSDASYVYVFHSRAAVNACVEKIPNTVGSYYLSNIYGVKRHIP